MESERQINRRTLGKIGAAIGIGAAVIFAATAWPERATLKPVCELSSPESKKYPAHSVTATTYWIGEKPGPDNDFISNAPSAWERDSAAAFGGVDTPNGRDFQPKHNTFYFALPAGEYTHQGLIPGARESSPWAHEISDLERHESLFKGRWIEICHDDKTVYAQWHDIGPNEYMDYKYVFGSEQPSNTFGQKAGLDLSPDASNALGMDGSDIVSWRFVDEQEVPDGPWRKYPAITNKTSW